jgi:hypothetical protein
VLAPDQQSRCLDGGQTAAQVGAEHLSAGREQHRRAGPQPVAQRHQQRPGWKSQPGADEVAQLAQVDPLERQRRRVDQHQPLDTFRCTGGKVGGHKATHRVADQCGALDLQRVEQRLHMLRRIVEHEGLAAARAKARKVDLVDGEVALEHRHRALPPAARRAQPVEQEHVPTAPARGMGKGAPADADAPELRATGRRCHERIVGRRRIRAHRQQLRTRALRLSACAPVAATRPRLWCLIAMPPVSGARVRASRPPAASTPSAQPGARGAAAPVTPPKARARERRCAQGSTADDAVADQPIGDVVERPGYPRAARG